MARQSDESLGPFPATQWSLVARAGERDGADSREALSMLLQRYLPALRAHLVIEKRIPPDRASDLLQGFVADKIIEQDLLRHAEKSKGKFRSFLLVTLNHYIISQHRSDTAAKRAPRESIEALDERATQLPGGHDPSAQFNIAWARQLLDEAIGRMKVECTHSKRLDVWTVFEGRVLRVALDGQEASEYSELIKQLGLATPLEACRLLTTAKRMFSRILQSVAGEYAGADGDADAEIEDLRQTLSKGGSNH